MGSMGSVGGSHLQFFMELQAGVGCGYRLLKVQLCWFLKDSQTWLAVDAAVRRDLNSGHQLSSYTWFPMSPGFSHLGSWAPREILPRTDIPRDPSGCCPAACGLASGVPRWRRFQHLLLVRQGTDVNQNQKAEIQTLFLNDSLIRESVLYLINHNSLDWFDHSLMGCKL